MLSIALYVIGTLLLLAAALALLVGGALALIEPACNTVVFHFHEKVWKRIEARRAAKATPLPA